jgi:putative flippase GtrA
VIRSRLRALASVSRLGRFLSVGVVGLVFDVTTATALRELGVFPEVAVFAGIEVAIVVMFLLNDTWTFAEQGGTGVVAMLRRFATSNVVRLGGILVQLATFRFLYRVVGIELTIADVDAWFVVAKLGGIGAGVLVNYVAESLFTWRVTRD